MRGYLKRNPESPIILFWMLIVWVIINLFQGAFTGLLDDEALYWFHGQRLDWGSYEQGPMAGYVIRLGYSIFPIEMGVRLGSLAMSVMSVYLISRIADVKNYFLYGALIFSVLIIHAGGFIATPDVPAVFFVVLFFLVYKHYLLKPSLLNSVLWGASMAGIMYSKYNGLLIIVFAIIPNLVLLKKRTFYLAVFSGILLFSPHIFWLFQNDFQTVNFILFERSAKDLDVLLAFKDYILGVILIFGPLMSFVLIGFTISRKPQDPFERSLKFSALTILLFFLIYNFRGRVEGNWTAPAVIPMLILTYKSLENRITFHKTIYFISLISIVIIMVARIFLVYNFIEFPKRIPNITTLYHWDDWAKEVEDHAGDCPVVFYNSYQRATKYIFYSQKQAISLDNYKYHKTQFFYRKDIELDMQGKRVCVFNFSKSYMLPNRNCYDGKFFPYTCYTFVDNFTSFYRVPLEIEMPDNHLKSNSMDSVNVRIINPDPDTLKFDQNPLFSSYLVYYFYKDKNYIKQKAVEISDLVIEEGSWEDINIKIKTPENPGKYLFTVSIETGWLPPAKNTYYRTVNIY